MFMVRVRECTAVRIPEERADLALGVRSALSVECWVSAVGCRERAGRGMGAAHGEVVFRRDAHAVAIAADIHSRCAVNLDYRVPGAVDEREVVLACFLCADEAVEGKKP